MAIIPGTFYFLGKKRSKASEAYHTVAAGDNLWLVSQKYGVKLKKLKKYNRIEEQTLKPGSTVWLSAMRPKDVTTAEAFTTPVAVLNNTDTFTWADEIPAKDSVHADTAAVASVVIVKSDNEVVQPANRVDSVQTLQLTQETTISQDPAQQSVIEVVPANKNEHIVQPKETLYAIAKIYNVGVMDLVNWNNLDLQQGIKIGQILRVSPPQVLAEVVKSTEIVHEVGASDTLYSIARKYGVTIKELMDWNEKKDFAISAGEKLKIKQLQ